MGGTLQKQRTAEASRLLLADTQRYRIAPAENGQLLRTEFFGGGRYFAVDVRRDTGRITGLRT